MIYDNERKRILNNEVLKILKQIKQKYGIGVFNDADRVFALFSDISKNNEEYRAINNLIREVIIEFDAFNYLCYAKENKNMTADKMLIEKICKQKLSDKNHTECVVNYLAVISNYKIQEKIQEKTKKNEKVTFGKYKWRVLCVKKNSILLIADMITDIGIPYNRELIDVSWEKSFIRKWLNTVFLDRFTPSQQNRILKRCIQAEDNQWYKTNAGNPTEDKVFLLSVSEIVRYFGDSDHLYSRPNNHWVDEITVSDGLSCAIDDKFNCLRIATYKNENTWWWLRTPGSSKSKAAFVNASGVIFLSGELVFDNGGTSCVGIRPGVRPAMWIKK